MCKIKYYNTRLWWRRSLVLFEDLLALFLFVNRVGPYVGSKLRRQELVTLSVTLVDASVPVVIITRSFGLQ